MNFDPYEKWLGIPPGPRPPSRHQLLGVSEDETDGALIQERGGRQYQKVRVYAAAPDEEVAQCAHRILNEIGKALATLARTEEQKEGAVASEAPRPDKPSTEPADSPSTSSPARSPSWGRIALEVLRLVTVILPFDSLLRAVAGRDNTIVHNFLRVLALVTAVILAVPITQTIRRYISTIDASPGGATSSRESAVATAKLPQAFDGHTGWVASVAFSPDGSTLASGSRDTTVKLWDVTSREIRHTLYGHTGPVLPVAFSPDGSTLASGSDDKTVKLWDVATGEVRHTLDGHTGSVTSVAFSPDGKTLASGSRDKTVKLWDVTTGEIWCTLDEHTRPVVSVAFSPDGSTLASGSRDKTVKLWDVTTSTVTEPDAKRSGSGAKRSQNALVADNAVRDDTDAQTAGDTSRVSETEDNGVRVKRVVAAKLRQTLDGHTGWVQSIAFNPGGSTLASGSRDNTVRLWDVTTGGIRHTFDGHTDWVRAVAFSPDGTALASGGRDKTVKLWDVTMGEIRHTLHGHTKPVVSVAFSPDGTTLASGAGDNTVRLWDATTGEIRQTLDGHTDWVRSVAFSPDGLTLASGSRDKTVRFWDVNDSPKPLR